MNATIEKINNEIDWTNCEFIIKPLSDGNMGVAGYCHEEDWGDVCGVETNVPLIDDAFDDLSKLFTVDDSCEAHDKVHDEFELEDDLENWWSCIIIKL